MSSSVRTAATLTTLALLVVLGAAWGWSAFTKPLPKGSVGGEQAEAPVCVDKDIEAGTTVYRNEVTVSVYNAGGRSGAAGTTMQLLAEAGFAEGKMGNAPRGTDVRFVRIWADDPDNPAVRLVASHLGDPVVRPSEGLDAPGVIVLVGNDFAGLTKGRKKIVAEQDTSFCSPVID
ncbi:LytR C-terminal domain-containing protein [Nocardioides sp.]|uniref:LytR C-terminal domain-containing protein n=1 Tax=Nocardioides sp. TaxID=35761 RepID=UPI002734D952|nr:LytR C-terminal domain-containing protein [Nocardioides sp.]MDP3890307.1 LytR C-terminal domain-containing protein [Nocardioides sp.]